MKHLWKYIFGGYLAMLAFISVAAYLEIIPNEIKQFPYYDILLHFLLLGLASYFAHRAFNRKKIFKVIPVGPFIILLIAVIEESSQLFSEVRCFSVKDFCANIIGILVFYFFDLLISERKKSCPR